MRALLIAVSMLALASPAAAQVSDRAPEADVADTLNSPLVQEGVARAMSDVVDSVLDIRVGPLARVIDPYARSGDTLRDRADPYLADDIEDETRRATRMMGAMAGEFAILMPQLRASVTGMSRRLEAARDRFDDREYEDDRED